MVLKEDLARIVGPERVSDDPGVLEEYSKDYSFVQPRRPRCVAYPSGTQEVAEVVKYANERSIAVTPRSSGVSFYGGGIPSQGGIVLDLTRMNRILEIDPLDRRVRVEPGVTWVQLNGELSKHGMMVCNPLLPHPKKSAVTSTMDREPMLIPKSEYSEVFRTCEMVLPNGQVFHTGTAIGKGQVGKVSPGHFIPSNRIFMGAQGTLGIVTWAILNTEFTPVMNKILFMPFDDLEGLVEPIYKLERRYLGSECLVLNRFNLATILADNWPADLHVLCESLPPWTVVLNLSAGERLPEEKIAYEEEAVLEVASQLGFKVQTCVGGIAELQTKMLPLLRQPWTKSDTYWKFRYKGARHDIFFHTTLNRAAEFTHAVGQVAARHEYPIDEIGIYIQPMERARAVYCEYGFCSDPDHPEDVKRIRDLFLEASELAISMGAFFATPYGPWADMVYRRAASYTAVMKVVKDALDPNHIMNPGKLCF